jgi:hypothetical protein
LEKRKYPNFQKYPKISKISKIWKKYPKGGNQLRKFVTNIYFFNSIFFVSAPLVTPATQERASRTYTCVYSYANGAPWSEIGKMHDVLEKPKKSGISGQTGTLWLKTRLVVSLSSLFPIVRAGCHLSIGALRMEGFV